MAAVLQVHSTRLLAGSPPADVLLDDDGGSVALGLQGSARRLPLAKLCGLPEAAAGEVATHMRLDDDRPPVGLQAMLSSALNRQVLRLMTLFIRAFGHWHVQDLGVLSSFRLNEGRSSRCTW